jgi:hypothetical protein
MIQTRRIHPDLVAADAFEHQRDLLDGRIDVAVMTMSWISSSDTWSMSCIAQLS